MKINGFDIQEEKLVKIENKRLFTPNPGIRKLKVEDYYLENVLKDKIEHDFNNSFEDLINEKLTQESYIFKLKELIPNSEGREIKYEEKDLDQKTKKIVLKSYEDFVNNTIQTLKNEIDLAKSPNYWSKDENDNLINKDNNKFDLISKFSYLYNKTLNWKEKDERYQIVIEGFEEQKEFMKQEVLDSEKFI